MFKHMLMSKTNLLIIKKIFKLLNKSSLYYFNSRILKVKRFKTYIHLLIIINNN